LSIVTNGTANVTSRVRISLAGQVGVKVMSRLKPVSSLKRCIFIDQGVRLKSPATISGTPRPFAKRISASVSDT
jgi:hypothetical protein